jgi:tetratricopeptide (TPR) repeat protein
MAIGLIGISLWLIYFAAAWGVADLFAKQANYDLQQWEKGGRITQESWKSIHTMLGKARYLEPYNPDILEYYGTAYYRLSRYGAVKKIVFQQALNYYLKAVQQKPVSAYTWANIAIIKFRLRQYDARLIEALENASVLGAWVPFVQHAIAEVGLAAWYRLPKKFRKKGRAVVFATIERGMHKQAHLMMTLIKRHKRKYVMCLYGRQNKLFADFCRIN